MSGPTKAQEQAVIQQYDSIKDQKQAIIQLYLSTPGGRMKLAASIVGGAESMHARRIRPRPVPWVTPETPLNLKRRKF